MRIKITLQSEQLIYLTYQYPLQLRGLIYQLLPTDYSEFLHDQGFQYGKRQFKLFTFSRIFGRRVKRLENKEQPLVFNKNIHFYLGSPIKDILEYVTTSSFRNKELRLGANRCELKSIEVEAEPIFGNDIKIRMLSPMAIRSTVLTSEGKKNSDYHSPYSKEFSELIRKNLEKKYKLVYGEELNGELEIIPEANNRERLIKGDKGFWIKAWDGDYRLKGTPELIQLSYSTGFGEKNSMGLGMWIAL